MKYIVLYRLSRTQMWVVYPPGVSTAEEAIELANSVWRTHIDNNAYVDVRIQKQAK